jgi:hypothetical protein
MGEGVGVDASTCLDKGSKILGRLVMEKNKQQEHDTSKGKIMKSSLPHTKKNEQKHTKIKTKNGKQDQQMGSSDILTTGGHINKNQQRKEKEDKKIKMNKRKQQGHKNENTEETTKRNTIPINGEKTTYEHHRQQKNTHGKR